MWRTQTRKGSRGQLGKGFFFSNRKKMPGCPRYFAVLHGDPTAGTGSGGHVALSHVCILSMLVSSMVADARFGRAAARCFDTNP